MALQQKNKSLPKHLQHMRLQKEQEEEQWISGEELCTEGSSDEETSTKHKDNLIKKSRSKTKVASPRDLYAKSSSTLSTASSSGNSEDKSGLESERSSSPNPMKWRPKRELINIAEAKWKLESEFRETMEQLKMFKKDFEVDETTSTISDKPEKSLCDGIDVMDCQIDEFANILKESRKDREEREQEICMSLEDLNFSNKTKKSSKVFFKMCKFKKSHKRSEDIFVKNLKKEVQNIKARLNRKYNFKNTKFKMNLPSYTDEDKIRLRDLLADIETEEAELLENVQTNLDSEAPNNNSTIVFENAFRTTDAESNQLHKIELQLKTLLEMCTNADLKGKNYESNISGFAIDENYEWKDYSKQTEEKIRNINTQLKKLKNQSTEEKELLESLEK